MFALTVCLPASHHRGPDDPDNAAGLTSVTRQPPSGGDEHAGVWMLIIVIGSLQLAAPARATSAKADSMHGAAERGPEGPRRPTLPG